MKVFFALLLTICIVRSTPVHSQINNLELKPVVSETVDQPVKEKSTEEPKTPDTPPETVTPQPVAVQVQERKGCELAYNYDWPQNIAYAVCMAESTGNQDAVNWSDNHGTCVGSFSLWQVGCFWYYYYGYTDKDFYNPDVNVQIAYQIYKRQGSFNAWTTYTRGSYRKYL